MTPSQQARYDDLLERARDCEASAASARVVAQAADEAAAELRAEAAIIAEDADCPGSVDDGWKAVGP